MANQKNGAPHRGKSDAPAPEAEAPEAEAPEPMEADDEGAAPNTEGAEPGTAPKAPAEASPEEQIADLKDRLLRAMAEVENVRRRADRDRHETSKYANTALARDLLTVADNLRRALGAVPEGAHDGDDTLTGLLTGVELIERELLSAFDKHGIKPIDPLGEKFDHNFHQAMFELENTGQPPGTIVQVMQTRYVIQDRLLRPAMVGIAKRDDKPNSPDGVDTPV
jgi:molecular chaperone GrpE